MTKNIMRKTYTLDVDRYCIETKSTHWFTAILDPTNPNTWRCKICQHEKKGI